MTLLEVLSPAVAVAGLLVLGLRLGARWGAGPARPVPVRSAAPRRRR